MSQSDAGLAALFMREFPWCKVKSGESAVVVTEPDSQSSYVAASLAGLAALGARAFQVTLPACAAREHELPVINRGNGYSTALKGFPELVDLLKRADFVVDLTVEGLIHSEERSDILQGGARMLYIKEPPDALARLLPTEERMRRIDHSVEILKRARKMTITSKAGTNLTVDLDGALIGGSYGFCARPGSWANWGQGLVAAFPASPEVDGEVVLVPGDIIFPFYKYVESSVRLRLKGGFVEAIDGDGVDAELIRDYMARWRERNAYGISHVGWGLHEKALWHALSLYGRNEAIGVDGRAFEGNFLFSTGPNHAAGRHTICHFDIPMRKCSIAVDGREVVREGAIVEPAIARAN